MSKRQTRRKALALLGGSIAGGLVVPANGVVADDVGTDNYVCGYDDREESAIRPDCGGGGGGTSEDFLGDDAEQITDENLVINDHPMPNNDAEIFHCSSVWHVDSITYNNKVSHRFASLAYGMAREDGGRVDSIHNQWSEALAQDGGTELIENETFARFGHEDPEESADGTKVQLAANTGLALGALAAKVASAPAASAVLGTTAIVYAFFGWAEYWLGGDEAVAEWGDFGHTDAVHMAMFSWTHDQDAVNPKCDITSMTGAAGNEYIITGDEHGISPNQITTEVSASEIDPHRRENLGVSRNETVQVLDSYPFEVGHNPVYENKRHPPGKR